VTQPNSSPRPELQAPLLSAFGAIADSYDLILCDVWGVLHNGLKPFPGTVDALERFRAKGGQVILVSNAPVPAGTVRRRLDKIGVPRKSYDSIVTSGDAILPHIVERGDAPLLHIGPGKDKSLFRTAKMRGAAVRLADLAQASYIVCTGLDDPDREELKDYDERLAIMLERRLPFLCANPDIVVHVGATVVLCAGALAERYEAMGGPIVQVGKPHAPIYELALSTGERLLGRSVSKARTIAIGDAMQTDVKGARDQGIDSLFITTGIHQHDIMKAGGDGALSIDEPALANLFAASGFAPVYSMAGVRW